MMAAAFTVWKQELTFSNVSKSLLLDETDYMVSFLSYNRYNFCKSLHYVSLDGKFFGSDKVEGNAAGLSVNLNP